MSPIDFSLIFKSIPYVLTGLPYTLGISGLSFSSGAILGVLLALARMSPRPLFSTIARVYISIMRGVPMLVVFFALYFGLPYLGISYQLCFAPMWALQLSAAPILLRSFVLQ